MLTLLYHFLRSSQLCKVEVFYCCRQSNNAQRPYISPIGGGTCVDLLESSLVLSQIFRGVFIEVSLCFSAGLFTGYTLGIYNAALWCSICTTLIFLFNTVTQNSTQKKQQFSLVRGYFNQTFQQTMTVLFIFAFFLQNNATTNNKTISKQPFLQFVHVRRSIMPKMLKRIRSKITDPT